MLTEGKDLLIQSKEQKRSDKHDNNDNDDKFNYKCKSV